MSNALAVAAVTETLSRVVEAAAKAAVPAADLSNGPPAPPPPSTPTQVGVYLFRVAENAALRADDLPTRDRHGDVLRRPQVALTLDYLISFHGQEDELECERMLGQVVSTLDGRPLLSPEAIQAAIDDRVAADPTHFLGGSDLPQQVEGIRVTPTELELDDMSKLWSVFFQQPYTLSVAYTVSVVLIEQDVTAQVGLPVRTRRVQALPVPAPHITSVVPAAVLHGASAAVLTLHGSALGSERIVVGFGDVRGEPRLVTTDRVVVPVPRTLAAGVHVVHVAHLVDWGTPAEPDVRPIVESNRVPFALQPAITAAPATVALPGPLELNVDPELRSGQTARLVLREVAGPSTPPRSFEIEQTVATAGRQLSFDLTGAGAGEYWLRVAVDDVTSPLSTDDTGFTGPRVVLQ